MMIVVVVVEIFIFVMGGIGGVYWGVVENFDILVDFQELVKIKVVVVCVGVKFIFDLLFMFEYFEIYGVFVLGYQMDEFFVFYI